MAKNRGKKLPRYGKPKKLSETAAALHTTVSSLASLRDIAQQHTVDTILGTSPVPINESPTYLYMLRERTGGLANSRINFMGMPAVVSDTVTFDEVVVSVDRARSHPPAWGGGHGTRTGRIPFEDTALFNRYRQTINNRPSTALDTPLSTDQLEGLQRRLTGEIDLARDNDETINRLAERIVRGTASAALYNTPHPYEALLDRQEQQQRAEGASALLEADYAAIEHRIMGMTKFDRVGLRRVGEAFANFCTQSNNRHFQDCTITEWDVEGQVTLNMKYRFPQSAFEGGVRETLAEVCKREAERNANAVEVLRRIEAFLEANEDVHRMLSEDEGYAETIMRPLQSITQTNNLPSDEDVKTIKRVTVGLRGVEHQGRVVKGGRRIRTPSAASKNDLEK